MPNSFFIDRAREDQILADSARRRNEYLNIRNTISTQMVTQAVQLAQQYPMASPGALAAPVATGAPAEPIMQADAQAPPPDQGGGNFFSNIVGAIGEAAGDTLSFGYEQVLKPTVRVGFGVLDTIAREAQRPVVAGLATIGGQADSFSQAYNRIGDSPGLNFLQGDLDTSAEGGTLGTGFFIGGQAGARSAQEQTLSIDGGAPTLGRAIAANTVGYFQDPGSLAYNTVAFTTQFAADVLTDPSALVLGGAGRVGAATARATGAQVGSRTAIMLEEGLTGLRQAGNLNRLTLADVADIRAATSGREIASTGDLVTRLKATYGAVETPWRQSILAEKAENILNQTEMLEALRTRDAFDIYNSLSRRTAPLNEELLARIARSTDTNEIADTLAQAMSLGDLRGSRILRGVGRFNPQSFSHYVSRLPVVGERLTRFAGMNPAGIYSADDLLGSAARLDNLEKQAFVPEEIRRGRFNEMIDLALPEPTTVDDIARAVDDVFDLDDIDAAFDAAESVSPSLTFDRLMRERLEELATTSFDSLSGDDLRGIVDEMGELDRLVANGNISTAEARQRFRALREEKGLPRGFRSEREFRREVDRVLRLNDPKNLTRKYIYDDLGTPPTGPTTASIEVDGVLVTTPTAQRLSDLSDFSTYIDEDFVRGVRREAERSFVLNKVYTSNLWDGATSAARWMTRSVFKPMVLLRPAYFAREFLDGQLRQAAHNAPVDTIFTNPFNYLGYLWRARNRGDDLRTLMGKPFREMANDSGLLADESLGLLDQSDQIAARYRNMAESIKPQVTVDDQGKRVFLDSRGETTFEQHARHWRFSLQHVAKDPGNLSLHRFGYDIDSWLDNWATSQEGRSYFNQMAEASPSEFGMLAGNGLDANLDVARKWAESQRAFLVGGVDNGQQFSGLLGGVDTPLHQIMDEGGARIGDEFIDLFDPAHRSRMEQLLTDEYADLAPPRLYAPSDFDIPLDAQRGLRDRIVSGLANYIMSAPSNKYLRLPVLRQRIVANLTDVLPHIEDVRVRQAIIDDLTEKLSLTRKEVRALRDAGTNATPSWSNADYANEVDEALASVKLTDDMTPEQFEQQVRAAILSTSVAEDAFDIAKAKTFDEASEMLFDVSNRSNLQANFDIAIPFVDAYAEAISSYARLMKENPAFFIKGMQAYQFMREEGFFYANDFGEEVFTMPGGGALTAFIRRMNEAGGDLIDIPHAAAGAAIDTLTGNTPDEQIRLEGRVQGLNIVLHGVGPGFGPAVQWSAGAFLPDTAEFQTFREFINPFGSEFESPSDITDLTEWARSITPAWMDKFVNGFSSGNIDPVQFNSAVSDALHALAESGNYKPEDPRDQQRLVRDAERAGRYVLMVRGLAQSIAPTGPAGTWRVKVGGDNTNEIPTAWDPESDPEGVYFTLGTLARDYQEMYRQYGDMASQMFVERYGKEPYYLTQAKTRALSQLPATLEGQRWIDRHREEANIYASVIGYFAPETATDEFSYSVYRQQIESGDREMLTPQQQLQMATQTRARSIYYAIKDQVDATGVKGNARQTILSQVRGRLEEMSPGWNLGILGIGEKGDFRDRISLMERAAFDEGLADSPVSNSVRVYFQVRRQLLDLASQREGRPLDQFGEVRDADFLQVLQQVGLRISNTDANFQPVWASFLSREVT